MKTMRHIPILAVALAMATALPLAAQQGLRGDRTGPRDGVAAQRGAQGQQARGARAQGPWAGQGQAARGAQRARADRGMQGIERILGLSTVLELTDAQVEQLNTLRVQGLERREAQRGAMARLRSDLAAGQATPEEVRERLQALRSEADRPTAAPQVREILTDEQRTKLQELARTARRGGIQGGIGRGGGPAGLPAPGWQGRRR